MADTSLHSLHAAPVTNVADGTVEPASERELAVEFPGSPDAEHYLDAVADSLDELAQSSAALVVSLGYDIVAGDPHGSWAFEPEIFTEIGRLLAACRPARLRDPGGRLRPRLPGRMQRGLRHRPAGAHQGFRCAFCGLAT